MIQGDYTEQKRLTKSGKTVTDKIITTVNGTKYAIGPRLGEGGVAPVVKCRRCSDEKWFAFKEYVPNPKFYRVHAAIKKIVKKLIADPIKDDDGTVLKTFVPPLELVELKASKGFGYIMELVDTKAYINYGKQFRRNYPDADILCEIGKNIAHLFKRLHQGGGLCYKDINEGNIYMNVKNGDVRFIDCDNISDPEVQIIDGTPGYMAPEIYAGFSPDTRTDDYSMAVYLFRILVWGWPLLGKKTNAYLLKNNTTVHDSTAVIYGSQALFCLDPVDKSNSIIGMGTPESEMVEMMWASLPDELRANFTKTFSDGLKRREARVSANAWYRSFDELQKNGIVTCKKCGRKNFGSATNKQKKCIYCDAKLPLLPTAAAGGRQTRTTGNGTAKTTKTGTGKNGTTTTKTGTTKTGTTKTGTTTTQTAAAAKELQTVTFYAVRRNMDTISVTAKRRVTLQGKTLHPALSGDILKLEYAAQINKISAVNLSGLAWTVNEDGKKTTCKPGGRVILKPNQVITVAADKVQLQVKEIK